MADAVIFDDGGSTRIKQLGRKLDDLLAPLRQGGDGGLHCRANASPSTTLRAATTAPPAG